MSAPTRVGMMRDATVHSERGRDHSRHANAVGIWRAQAHTDAPAARCARGRHDRARPLPGRSRARGGSDGRGLPRATHEAESLGRAEGHARAPDARAGADVAVVLDVGETEDRKQVMVLELVEGTSLDTIMDDFPLAPERIVRFIAHLLRGLEHAHAMGLVHRDLMPDNEIVERDDSGVETARIVDFGIATLVEKDGTLEK